MAFSMIDVIENTKQKIKFSDLGMRIGIHTGNFIGGIVGTTIVRYDIYGEDVTIANKMESNGTIGMVQVSEVTKILLESSYHSEFIFTLNKKPIILPNSDRTVNGYYVDYSIDENEDSYF